MNRLRQLLLGSDEGIGGTVYGTIVALAALAAGSADHPDPGELAILVGVTSLAIWIAHVYSHGLGESIERQRRLDAAELRAIGGREFPILAAAGAPILGLLLGVVGLASDSTAVWVAFALGIASLAGHGAGYARVERLGPLATAAVVAANVALGLLVIALKVLVLH